ncbi:MAG: phosphodiester glycosidase family protein [Herbinix sp.]|jgi:exopolysaccharide biosynthesis protein|nr:phosphodiester glycosidase family protein [Herbinix sp.]
MHKLNHKKRIKIIIITTISLLVFGIVLYKLADRYLIDHVEVNNAFADTAKATPIPASQPDSSEAVDIGADIPIVEEEVTPFIDDWNYSTDALSIKISQETKGSGSDKITYYVADVQFDSIESLKTAFAYNKFGTNIIQDTSVIAEDSDAILAINGDYYGFRDDGIIIRNGQIFRDEPIRDGLAIYEDGTMKPYDETTTSAAQLIDDGVVQTLSFGPSLIKDGIATKDFGKTVIDTNIGNHAIENANPRTGIGMISANHFIFIVVDGRSKSYSRGMSLSEFAQVFTDLGCTQAYNLDGGGSSTMYFMGRVVNNPLGKGKERGVSDILYIN